MSLTEGGNRKRRSDKKITETPRLILFSQVFLFILYILLKAQKKEKADFISYFLAVIFPPASQLIYHVCHIFLRKMNKLKSAFS